MKKMLFALVLCCSCLVANATIIYAPSTSSSMSSTSTYCQDATASAITFAYTACRSGTGGSSGVAITIKWYQNTTNTTTGGTLVSTTSGTCVTSITAGAGTVTYIPLTDTAGTRYYYCTITWTGTGTCNTSGTLTSATATAVVINSLPTPTYTASPSAPVCANASVTYTTQAGNTAYAWSVPGTAGTNYNITSGGIGSTSSTVTLTWLTAGSKTVTVNYNNASGCAGASAASNTLTVNANPTPTFTTSPASSTCLNDVFTYTTQSGKAAYNWSIPGTAGTNYNITSGGTGTTDNTVVLSWLTSGSKTVTVNYNSTAGCTTATPATNNTTVNTLPTPTFSTSPSSPVCANTSVTYTTQSGKTGYAWSVPGTSGTDYSITAGGIGTTSNTVTLTWLTAGSKTVTVNYNNAAGCDGASPATNTLTVNPLPAPTFTAEPGTNSCVNDSYTYTTQSGQTSYTWSVPGTAGTNYTITSGGTGSASNTVTLTWLTTGSKTVTVNYNTTAGCTTASPASNVTSVNSLPTPTFSTSPSSPICAGASATYTTQTGKSNYAWNVPGTAGTDYTITSGGIGTTNNSVTLTWLTSGSKVVTVNYDNASGCDGASPATNTLTVNANPTRTFSASPGTNSCLNDSYTYTTQSGNTSYTWSVPGTAGTNYTITSGGTGTTSSIVTLTWLTTGSKTVTVNYTTTAGCTSATAASNTTTVNTLATPTFSASPSGTICANTNLTYTTQTGKTNYVWSVPGTAGTDYTIISGGTGTANNTVTLSWLTTGSKTVTVNYDNAAGCDGASPATNTVTVNANPIRTFTTAPAIDPCINGTVTYTTQSGHTSYTWSIPGTSGTNYTITGGGTTTNSVTLKWLTTGSKTVTANYTTTAGCTLATPASSTTTANAVPTVSGITASSTFVLTGSSFTLTAGSVTGSGALTSYNWSGPGGYTSTGTSSSDTIVATATSASGSYSVSVTYPGSGCTSAVTSSSVTVSYAPPAITSVSPATANPGTSLTITGTNFNTTAMRNKVFFGATQAIVTSASATSLTVTAPVGGTYAPISVLDSSTAKTAFEQYQFMPEYNSSRYMPGMVHLNTKVDFSTGTGPQGITIGDLDGDGMPDMVAANSSLNTISVFRNIHSSGSISSSSFASPVTFTAGSNPMFVKIADLDGDGKPEIIVANYNSSAISVFKNTTTSGAFSTSSFAAKVDFTMGFGGLSVAVADFDGDGRPDIAATCYSPSMVYVLRNITTAGVISSSSFASALSFTLVSAPGIMFAGDLDGDGKPDMAVPVASGKASAFLNTSSPGAISFATRVDFTAGSYPMALAAGDIDGDGKPELIVANNTGNTISVLRNTSTSGVINSGSFATKVDFGTGGGPYEIALGDLDGDGKVDIAVANDSTATLSVFRNTATSGAISSGSLSARANFTTGSNPFGISIDDLDGDSKPDIVAVNRGSSSVSVLSNNPLLPVYGASAICVGSSITLQDSVSGGTWSSSATGIATVNASGVVTGVSAGTAIITYSVTGGSDTVLITVNPLPVLSIIPVVSAYCIGASIGITVSGAATYSWAPATGLDATTGAAVTCNATATTTYTITGISAAGCTGTNTQTITVNPLPVLTVTPVSSAICNGSSTNITATGAATYSWNSATGLSATTGTTVTCTALSTTTYTLTGTTTAGCSDSATITITVNPVPVLTVTPVAATYCVGSSSNITAAGATTYSWAPATGLSATTGATVTCNATTTTSYSITGTSTAGCNSTVTRTITVNAQPTVASITPSAITACTGIGLTLTAGTATGTGTLVSYNWTGPNSYSSTSTTPTKTFSPTTTAASGVYSLTVTYPNPGCTSAAVVTSPSVTVVTRPTVASITASPSVLCFGSSLTLTAGTVTGATRYNWTGPASYSTTGTATTAVLTPTTITTSGVYSLTVTDTSTGCTSAVAVTSPSVTVKAVPVVASVIPSSTNLCTGTALTLTRGTVTASGTLVSYNWSGPDSYSVTGTSIIAVLTPTTTAASGIYSLYVVYNGTGCTSATVTTSAVTVNTRPTISGITASADTLCTGSALTLTAGTPAGTGSLTSYNWTGPNSFSATGVTAAKTFTPTTVAASGTYSLTVTYPGTGCTSTAAVTSPSVTVKGTPSAITGLDEVCLSATNNVLLLSQNFNSGLTGQIGGTWATSTFSGTTITPWEVRNSPGYGSYAAGDGSPYVEAVCNSGYSQTYFTSPSFSTQGLSSGTLSFNHYYVTTYYYDYMAAIEYSIDGGSSWTTLQSYVDANAGSSTWSISTIYSISLPAGMLNQPDVRIRWNYYAYAYYTGIWAVDNIVLSGTKGNTLTLSNTSSSGTWSSSNTSLATVGATTGIVRAVAAGALVITYSVPGCGSVTYPVTVNQPSITVGTGPTVCRSATSASLPYTATTGSPAYYRVDWNSTANSAGFIDMGNTILAFAAGGGTVPLIVPASVAAGTYTGTISVSDSAGCSSSSPVSFSIVVIARPTVASITPSATTLCAGTALTLTAGSVTGTGTLTSYNWSGPNSFSTTSATNTAVFTPTATASSGVYSVTVTYPGNGCTSAAAVSLSVTVRAVPDSITGPTSVCTTTSTTLLSQNFNSGTLTGSVGGTWGITYTSGTSASEWIVRASPGYSNYVAGDGSYYVEAASDAYATGTTTTFLTSSSFSTVGFSSAQLTFNHYYRYYGFSYDNTAEVEYSINGGSTWNLLQSYLGGNAGAATWSAATPNVTLSLPAAAIGQSNVKLRWNYSAYYAWYWAVDNIGVTALGAITLANTTTGGTWSSSNTALATVGASTGVVTAVAVGSPVITYTTPSCGYVTQSITISAPPTITLGSSPTICRGGTSVSLPYSTTTGSPTTYSITWSAAAHTAGFTDVSGTSLSFASGGGSVPLSVPATAAAATYSATLSITNAYSCKIAAPVSFNVIVAARPTVASVTANLTSLCTGTALTLTSGTATGTGAGAFVSYNWSGPGGYTATTTTSPATYTPTVATTGAYSLSVTYANAGCTSAAVTTGTVTVNALPTVHITPATTAACTSVPLTLTADSVSGTGSIISYNWSGPNSYSASGTASYVTFTPTTTAASGTYSLTVRYTGTGCTSAVAVTSPSVTITRYPYAGSISGPSGLLSGATITLTDTVSGGIWSSSDSTIATVSGGVVTGGASGSVNISYSVSNSCGTVVTTHGVIVTAFQWTGAVSTNWNAAANWSTGYVPNASDDVYIPPGTTYSPEIMASASGTTRAMSISSGVTIMLDAGAVLNVKGDFANNGVVGGLGLLNMNGTTAQVVSGFGYVNNFDVHNTAGVNVATDARLTIKNVLSVTSGTLATGDSVVLYSDSLGTARVASLPMGTAITGKVKVNQFMTGGRRAYRFWAHPFDDYIGLTQLVNTVDITGAGGATNGFTTTGSNQPSAYRYDPLAGNSALPSDPGWKPFTSAFTTADTNKLKRYMGIRYYYRGSKGQGLGYGPYLDISSTVVSQWGVLNQGNQDVTLSRGSSTLRDYNMIGNPYASPVDIGTVLFNAAQAGSINGAYFYIWNPFLGVAGQFQAIPYSTGGTTPAAIPYYLQANDAFQARAMHDGDQLHFTESNKSATVSNAYSLMKERRDFVSLYIYDAAYHPYDMLYIKFDDSATDFEDAKYDGGKPSGADVNFYSLSADQHKLAVDARPYNAEESIQLGISSNYEQDYIIRAENLAIPEGGKIYLHDKLLHQFVLLQQGTEYRFAVTKDTGTLGENRFELTMKPATIAGSPAAKGLEITMTPNPATDEVKIRFSQNKPMKVNVRILDLSGSTVYNRDMGNQQMGSITIPLNNLASGMYIVEVNAEGQKLVQKLIKE